MVNKELQKLQQKGCMIRLNVNFPQNTDISKNMFHRKGHICQSNSSQNMEQHAGLIQAFRFSIDSLVITYAARIILYDCSNNVVDDGWKK